MSFNFINTMAEEKSDLPIFKELARDLNTLELLTKDGLFYLVSKNEALKIWVAKALHKENSRYTYLAYSPNYGNEISSLFGRYLKESLLKSELKRMVEETLFVNPYILSVSDMSFERKGSTVKTAFVVNTIYGDFTQDITIEK